MQLPLVWKIVGLNQWQNIKNKSNVVIFHEWFNKNPEIRNSRILKILNTELLAKEQEKIEYAKMEYSVIKKCA